MHSIQSRLLILLLMIFILTWGTIAVFIWWRGNIEIHRVFDIELERIAGLVAVIAGHEEVEKDLSNLASDMQSMGYKFPIIFQAWSDTNQLLFRGPGTPSYPITKNSERGFSDEKIGGDLWRVYTIPLQDRIRLVHVAHPFAVRNQLIRNYVLNIIKPLVMIFPFLALIWLGVRRGLAPMKQLTNEIASRDQMNLEHLPVREVPRELIGLVDEINALFDRLREAINRNNKFTSNAAHELRTPIASTITHAHAAIHAENAEDRQHSLNQLIKSSLKLSHIVDQLLTIARIHPEQVREKLQPSDLHGISVQVLSELSPFALSKGIELELYGEGVYLVRGNEELTSIMLRNLINNAINACSWGDTITLTLNRQSGGISLEVMDTGPGIPDAEKASVFERFHRIPETAGDGAGLGLAIVRSIMTVYDGQVSLTDRKDSSGLVVTLRFPAID